MTMIKEFAPAKINLTLDVMNKRSDGYHEVRMVMQSISLTDILTVTEADGISMTCSHPTLPVDERNIAFKAAKLILSGTGKGVKINLEKRIPIVAGLAGGSSDAAAVLRGINRLYNMGKTHKELLEMAVKLGADVSFCLEGGTALAEGIGEKITRLPQLPKIWLVLVKPHFGVSTALVYRSLKINEISIHPDTQAMINAINNGNKEEITELLCNVLEDVTFKIKPMLLEIKTELLKYGAQNVLMSGSGPTVFGVFRDESQAKKAVNALQLRNTSIYIAHTL